MAPTRPTAAPDRRIILWLAAATLLAVVLFSALGPGQEDNDPEPTTFNAGSHGAKAAYLLLPQIGYDARRWEQPATALTAVDPAKTTLILTSPMLPVKGLKPLQQQLESFMQRGGTVLATGANGAKLLPGAIAAAPTRIYSGLCFTLPEGPGALAQAGQVTTDVPARWAAPNPQFRVAQRCSSDAVVVSYAVGPGQAIWWASPRPLTNQGLADDPNLRLLLASIGPPGRIVLFDEYLHQQRESISDTLRGLPWWSLATQCALIVLLLVLSNSRRSGPLRAAVTLPRTSPLEFAESMGRLYARAQATPAATEAARTRVLHTLREQCGIPREILAAGPASIAESLSARFGGDWSALRFHLQQAQDAASSRIAPTSALKLVQSLEEDHRRLLAALTAGARSEVPA